MASSALPPDTSSFPLSDMDNQTLYTFGRNIAQYIVGVISETAFISVYTIFFAVAVYSIVRKGFKTRSSFIMLLVVIYLYVSSASLWALNLTWAFRANHSLLMAYPNLSLQDRIGQANLDLSSLATPMEALFLFNMVIGDTVVIWRAWVLYQRTPSVVAIPCILLLTSVVFAIIDIRAPTRPSK